MGRFSNASKNSFMVPLITNFKALVLTLQKVSNLSKQDIDTDHNASFKFSLKYDMRLQLI